MDLLLKKEYRLKLLKVIQSMLRMAADGLKNNRKLKKSCDKK